MAPDPKLGHLPAPGESGGVLIKQGQRLGEHQVVIAPQGHKLATRSQGDEAVDHPSAVGPPVHVISEGHQRIFGFQPGGLDNGVERPGVAVDVSKGKKASGHDRLSLAPSLASIVRVHLMIRPFPLPVTPGRPGMPFPVLIA